MNISQFYGFILPPMPPELSDLSSIEWLPMQEVPGMVRRIDDVYNFLLLICMMYYLLL